MKIHWSRQKEIAETRDGKDWYLPVHRRLNIRRIKHARLPRVLINPQRGVEGPFDIRGITADVQQEAIRVSRRDREMVGPGKFNDALILRF